jgi:putative endonuclease
MQQSLRLPWHRSELPTSVVTGREGEEIARRFLSRLGYRLLGVNVRVGPHDEIDIVAFDPSDRVLVFAEVKSRSKDDPDYRPGLNLTPVKRASMTRAARAWVAKHGWNGGYRMDAIFVTDGKLKQHVKELDWK